MRSLRTKMILVIALMLGVLGVVLTSLIYLQMKKSVEDGIAKELSAVVAGQGNVIGEWARGKVSIVEAAVPVATLAEPLVYLDNLNRAGGFDVSYVGYADKRMLYSDGRPQKPDYDPTARPWYALAKRVGKPAISEPYVDFDTKKLVVTVVSPVMANGQLIGVAGGDVFIDALVKSVLGVKLNVDGYAFLVEKSGKVIAHPDPSLTLKPIADKIPALGEEKVGALAESGELAEVDSDGVGYFTRLVAVPGTDWYLGVAVNRDQVLAPLNKLLYTVLATALIVFLAMVPLAGVVLGRMLSGLARMRDAMKEISAGEGDLTRRIQVSGEDEIAETAHAFNAFIERLHTMFCAVRDEADRVSGGVEAVGSTIERVADDSRQIADVSGSNAATLEEITISISHIADAAREADGLVVRTGEVSSESAEAMERITREMERTMNAVRELSGMLTTLDGRSQQISGITNVIRDIADQTNLLALNAAIEAARAGEQGRGFAVVADEVRKLAERTGQATVEISGMVSAIRDETRQAVDNMQHALGSVDGGVALTQAAVAQIGEIRRTMEAVVAKMSEIALSTSEQHNATTQIAQSTERINSRIIESDGALQGAHHTLTGLAEAAGSLRQQFSRFRL
ncbi:methyl-accepting chemotaxis protein [Crenobacter cavernae]|uniref:Methyl-accepting chemotaxis protein n=1 Tax=Crenobacter cavernae TaxID=2290923 RepID=A0ABY0FI11_9NEIS|nr:methyl-accepting chemotaxis protein [Crenobacter cavernae]RXZ44655.1 methyl-accepting chemotaxis protein [Crenobacter cavernae]